MNPTVTRVLHILGIVVAVVVPVLTAILTGLPASSKEALVVAAVLGILSSLKGAFGTPDATATVTSASKGTADLLMTAGATPQKGDVVKIDPQSTRRGGGSTPGLPLALLVLAGALLWGSAARAQTPSDVAPPLSFCFGATTTCVVPDSGLQAVNYDLIHKQWSGGITGAGIGYALLYKSETPYASGVSVHVTFNFNQAAPSFLAPTFAVVVAHYLEAGYTPVFYDGRIGQQITLMVGLNAETLTALLTGKRLDARLAEARAAASGKAEAR